MEKYLLVLPILVAVSAAAFISSHQSIADELSKFDEITEEFIEKINSAQDSWVAGHNFPVGTKFSDLKILARAIRKPNPPVKNIEVPDEIPKSFDSRNQWPHCQSIREIKNQGHCGSCWAVSSATSMSDRLCISTKGKFNADISAQNIVSCSEDTGCFGGWPSSAWDYFINTGVPTGGDYHSNKGCQPYLVEPCINRTANNGHPKKCPSTDYVKTPACQNKCYNTKYHKSLAQDKHYGKEVNSVPQDVKQIQADIMKNGPSVGIITVYSDFLTYKSGVYSAKSSVFIGLHAIRIIGWGKENGKDYWLITNQWGKEWGLNGTVKMLRGVNECGIESEVTSGITKS